METKNIPTIVMLAAAFVTSVVMYINDYDLNVTLKAILVVFLVFYILGLVVKRILDKFCPPPKPEGENGEEDAGEAAESEEKPDNEDGSVIEKK